MKLDNNGSQLLSIHKTISNPGLRRLLKDKKMERRASITNAVTRESIEKIDELKQDHALYEDLTSEKESNVASVQDKPSSSTINKRRSSFTNLFSLESIDQINGVGKGQHNLRKVTSMCTIFNKNHSKPIPAEKLEDSSCCDYDESQLNYIDLDDSVDIDDSWNEGDMTFLTSNERESLRSSLHSITENFAHFHIEPNKEPRSSSTSGIENKGKASDTCSTIDCLDLSSTSMKHFIKNVLKEETKCQPKGMPRVGSLSDLFSKNSSLESAIENLKKCQGDIIQSIHSQNECRTNVSDPLDREDEETEVKDKDWKLKSMFRNKKQQREHEIELFLSM